MTEQRGPASADTILYLDAVSVSFDGFKAIDNLSFFVEAGELRAVIGPQRRRQDDDDGSGHRQDPPRPRHRGVQRGDRPHQARRSAYRQYRDRPQIPETDGFRTQTVFENLELALAGKRGVFQSLFFKLTEPQAERIDSVLGTIRLADVRGKLAGALSHGQKQWLEIGMLLMQEPELLLVDEPAAGMTDAETMQTADMLKAIAGERSVVVVEHDMAFIRALDCRVTVLNEGTVLAEGSLDAMQRDERVIESYLGR